ncbi:MAG TPA: methyl-accepting chemotaxis protein [Desulfuromonadaceae bacterium]|jgi:methyl-accepting chemotaxis protein
MNVRQKLTLSVVFTTIGIATVTGISVYAVTSIKSQISVLTGKSAPMHLKILQLQQTVEKVSADFFRLGLTSEERELGELASSIDRRIKEMEELTKGIQQGGNAEHSVEPGIFRGIRDTVVTTANERLKDVRTFREESGKANAQLATVETGMATIGKGVSSLGVESLSSVDRSNQANLQTNSVIKRLLTLQNRYRDLAVITGEIESVRNKFKLGPLKEKIKSVSELTNSIAQEKGDPPIIKDAKEGVFNIISLLSREDGLIAARLELFEAKIDAAKFSERKSQVVTLTEERSRELSNQSDAMEIQISKDRQRLSTALGFQARAGEIINLGNAVSVGVKEIGSLTRLAMLATTEAELNDVNRKIGSGFTSANGSLVLLKRALTAVNETKKAAAVSAATGALQGAAVSVTRIIEGKKNVLKSDAAMAQALAKAKQIAAEQSVKGEEQVKNVGENQKAMLEAVQNSVSAAGRLLYVILLVSGIVIAVTIVLGWRVASSIVSTLKGAESMAKEMAAGDLTQRIEHVSADEIGRMCGSLNSFAEGLNGAVRTIVDRSQSLSTAADELSSRANQMASIVTKQTDDLQTIATSTEQMSASVAEVAQNVRAVADRAGTAQKVADEGNQVVNASVVGMERIAVSVNGIASLVTNLSEGSQKIGDIVGTINDIADQTNLLALNAAIEAARAGEQGHGFAVVADEVRKLASKTAESTIEISAMITAIQKEVAHVGDSMKLGIQNATEGTDLALKAREALERIVIQVQEISGMSGQIATTATQQSATIDDISRSITTLSDASRGLMGSMQETNSSAQTVDGIADELKSLTSAFKTA